jgi:hypothetical protein
MRIVTDVSAIPSPPNRRSIPIRMLDWARRHGGPFSMEAVMDDGRERLSASELSRRLAEHAEAVCRRYLPKGRREGRVWRIGDIDGAPGRSLAVRLVGPSHGRGAAGRWIDSATSEYGDLLDLIVHRAAGGDLGRAMRAARVFLALPDLPTSSPPLPPQSRDTVGAARAL